MEYPGSLHLGPDDLAMKVEQLFPFFLVGYNLTPRGNRAKIDVGPMLPQILSDLRLIFSPELSCLANCAVLSRLLPSIEHLLVKPKSFRLFHQDHTAWITFGPVSEAFGGRFG